MKTNSVFGGSQSLLNKGLRVAFLAALTSVCFSMNADAQGFLERMADRAVDSAKRKVEQKVQDKVDRTVDRAVDAVLDPKAAKESKKAKRQAEEAAEQAEQAVATAASNGAKWTCDDCGASNTGNVCDDCGAKKPGSASAAAPVAESAKPAKKTVTAEYAKSDFVPGDEIFFDDPMEGEQLGEFPSKWDLIEGEVEVAKLDGKSCISFRCASSATIEPLMTNQKSYLPDVFTLEFDFYRAEEEHSMGYGVVFRNENRSDAYMVEFTCSGSTHGDGFVGYFTPSDDFRSANLSYDLESDSWHHFALSFNKRALKVYIDGKRVANIPNCVKANAFHLYMRDWGGFDDSGKNYVTNVRLAQGAVPLYDRLASDGRIITYAITFETGKADLKPESMVEISRIAKLMTENPNIQFEVQGHCDATGSDKVNDPLSQKRAEAIVDALVEQGIARARLTAVGKGSHSPLADNGTEEGRAKNRRVEFVKK